MKCNLHFAAFWTKIGKSIQHMSQLVGREVLGIMVASVDCLAVYQGQLRSKQTNKQADKKQANHIPS